MEGTVEKKVSKKVNVKTIMKWVCYALLFAGVVVSFVFYAKIWGPTSIFNKAISENEVLNWIYQHIAAVIRSVQIAVLAIAGYFIIRLIILKIFNKSNKQITFAKLFVSIVRWVLVIAVILMVLSAWGVDSTALLASAGIIALIIGLGAQTLVSDVISGLFIVFEGDFLVGDIVVVDGWRGTVEEIGLRTTKIVDAGGNTKIINNNAISSIVNQTKQMSLAKCVISMDYGESIERVELVIRDNLDTIREHIPAIMDGPYYKGITELGASSVDILLVAQCNEEDIYQVQRDLNREMYIIFNKNNINIPFPQLTISQRDENAYVDATQRVKNAAREFKDEQADLSKGFEEKVE